MTELVPVFNIKRVTLYEAIFPQIRPMRIPYVYLGLMMTSEGISLSGGLGGGGSWIYFKGAGHLVPWSNIETVYLNDMRRDLIDE